MLALEDTGRTRSCEKLQCVLRARPDRLDDQVAHSDIVAAKPMGVLGIAALAFFVAVVVVVVVLWDRLVLSVLGGVAVGATWVVAQSKGRWWFWPVVVVAALVVVAAFVVAVLIS